MDEKSRDEVSHLPQFVQFLDSTSMFTGEKTVTSCNTRQKCHNLFSFSFGKRKVGVGDRHHVKNLVKTLAMLIKYDILFFVFGGRQHFSTF